MGKLASKLRIGEKIGFGFGLVGLLFLGVIWQYHTTLQQSIVDYQHLQDHFGVKKSHAQEIENSMLAARRFEKVFLIERNESLVTEVDRYIDNVVKRAQELGKIDQSAALTATRIIELTNIYHQQFKMIVDAWHTKGFDHNSGLQGAFRNTVHELEEKAGHFKVGRLYLQLLQIRRREKDLGLRHETQYRDSVQQLVEEFKVKLADSELEQEVQTELLEEVETYRKTFDVYARAVLANQDLSGGKGPFRQAAHRLEALLNKHYIPDLEQNILQLRRREKDYLLRDDKTYVEMAIQELDHIEAQVDGSMISVQDKSMFTALLKNYERDFLALVEQNDRIDKMTAEMNRAVSEIELLVEENVTSANQMMKQMALQIDTAAHARENLMLWIVAGAVLLGIFFAVAIVLGIVHPLRKMAGLLDQLAYEEPVERMPFVHGSRDEVNAMAESVNTMADHKARFIAWWKMSMEESDACERLAQLLTEDLAREENSNGEFKDAEKELLDAILARHGLLSEQYMEISGISGSIAEGAERLLKQHPRSESETTINTIRHLAKSIGNILEMTKIPNGPRADVR